MIIIDQKRERIIPDCKMFTAHYYFGKNRIFVNLGEQKVEIGEYKDVEKAKTTMERMAMAIKFNEKVFFMPTKEEVK